MRIGAFANKNDIIIDAVRHYMDMGLVLPTKHQGQYDFDQRCQQQLDEIILLKSMGFQLKEIKTLFMFNMLGRLTDYQKEAYYGMLFRDKHEQIAAEMLKLEAAKDQLENKLEELVRHPAGQQHTLGVPLTAIGQLRCPKCSGPLTVLKGDIQDNQLIHGLVTCKSGHEYEVKDGILMIDPGVVATSFAYEDDYVSTYITATDQDYLENIYKRIDWTSRTMELEALEGKLILELGSGVGFALRNIYDKLPEDCLYMAVDHDLNRHRFLKTILEKADVRRPVLFVCCDFKRIPLASASVDMLLDFTGTSNYSFTHKDFLLDGVMDLTKKDSAYIGMFIIFRKFIEKGYVKEDFRHNFNHTYIQEKLRDLGYEKIEDVASESLYRGGEYENYFMEGEEVAVYQYYGKRLG